MVIRNSQEQVSIIMTWPSGTKGEIGLCLQLYFPDLANFAISSNAFLGVQVTGNDVIYVIFWAKTIENST